MEDRAVRGIQTVIRYIESRLGGRLELETVAEAVHCSKYHLPHVHRDGGNDASLTMCSAAKTH